MPLLRVCQQIKRVSKAKLTKIIPFAKDALPKFGAKSTSCILDKFERKTSRQWEKVSK